MTDLVSHFLVFSVVIVVALVIPMLIGKLVRPENHTPEKDAIYECGEPTIGSSYIQFDLRFYVVALLFIIFDVEIAFFFPWAAVYGAAGQLADTRLTDVSRGEISEKLLNLPGAGAEAVISSDAAQTLLVTGLFDILVFFSVLLVGFAYIWKRGDLDWVKAVADKARQAAANSVPPEAIEK